MTNTIKAGPGETLDDLHADHDPFAPINSTPTPAREWSRGIDHGTFRDTRAVLVCTLLAVDSWGA